MNVSNGRISILIATYNRLTELAACLRAIEKQIGNLDVEVCIVNDGGLSIQSVVQQYPKLRILFEDSPVNRGHVACRNQALKMATGEWIAICDDDDRFVQSHLAQLYQAIANRASTAKIAFGFSDAEIVELRQFRGRKELVRRTPFAWMDVDRLLSSYNPIIPSSVLYSRYIHEEIGDFDTDMHHYWDWDFWLRARQVTAFTRVPYCSLLYGVDEQGANQSANPEAMRTHLEKLIAKHDLSNLPSSNFWRMTQDRMLERERALSKQIWDGDMTIWTQGVTL